MRPLSDTSLTAACMPRAWRGRRHFIPSLCRSFQKLTLLPQRVTHRPILQRFDHTQSQTERIAARIAVHEPLTAFAFVGRWTFRPYGSVRCVGALGYALRSTQTPSAGPARMTFTMHPPGGIENAPLQIQQRLPIPQLGGLIPQLGRGCQLWNQPAQLWNWTSALPQ